jgi:hypothetical protein
MEFPFIPNQGDSSPQLPQSVLIILDPMQDPFLVQHRFQQHAICPAVVAMEIFWEAAYANIGSAPLSLVNFRIKHAWRFFADQPETGTVTISRQSSHIMECLLSVDLVNRDGKLLRPQRQIMQGQIELERSVHTDFHWIATDNSTAWSDVNYPSENDCISKNRVWHGEIFQRLKRYCFVPDRLYAELIAIDTKRLHEDRSGRWQLPSDLIDASFQAASIMVYRQTHYYSLPLGSDRFDFHACPAPQEICQVQVEWVEQDEKHAWCNLQARGASHQILFTITRFCSVLLQAIPEL